MTEPMESLTEQELGEIEAGMAPIPAAWREYLHGAVAGVHYWDGDRCVPLELQHYVALAAGPAFIHQLVAEVRRLRGELQAAHLANGEVAQLWAEQEAELQRLRAAPGDADA